MKTHSWIGLLFAALELTAGASAAAQGTGKILNTCTLLSPSEIRRVTNRPDLATGTPRQYEESAATYSNCIVAGAIDIGITLKENKNDFYARMRDTYIKAPPKLGFRVEKQSGLGDDAYWLFDPRDKKVKLETLVGGRQLSVGLGKFTGRDELVPEPEAKRIVLAIATALVPKVR